MLDWKKPELNDGEWIRPIVDEAGAMGSDLSFANIYLLRDKYDIEIRDKKKETEYRAEIPVINEYFETLKKKVINETMTKLLKFYKVEIEV